MTRKTTGTKRKPGFWIAEKNRYQMREKLVSIGDDFWIENAQGQKDLQSGW